jgi:hypothetical protein
MRVNALPLPPPRGALRASADSVRASEKPSASSDLGKDDGAFTKPEQQAPPRVTVELVCQSETPRFDPNWDGPRLMPVFVAQLLGQVMREQAPQAASVSVRTAYDATQPRTGKLFDRKS